MMKRVWIFIAVFAVLSAFPACSGNFIPSKQEPVVCYNGFLGLTVIIPAGWHTEYKNDVNLTPSPVESGSLSALDLYSNSDGSVFEIELITIQNVLDSTRSDHVEIMLYADYAPDFAESDYFESLIGFIAEQSDNEYGYNLAAIDHKNIAGQNFTRFFVEVAPFSFNGRNVYYEEYYVTYVNRSYFVAYVNYWGDSETHRAQAYEALESCFRLDAQGNPVGPDSKQEEL